MILYHTIYTIIKIFFGIIISYLIIIILYRFPVAIVKEIIRSTLKESLNNPELKYTTETSKSIADHIKNKLKSMVIVMDN